MSAPDRFAIMGAALRDRELAKMTVATIVPTKPDTEVAADLRRDIEAAIGPVLAVLDKADAAGFEINFQLGKDYGRRNVVAMLKIAKLF